nr:hypothetical protein Iba_chr03dCG9790 [Ipomoea batatas]
MIFSFLLNFFTTGLTFSGKLKGIVRQTWPSWYNIFWDQRTLADRTDPPTTLGTFNVYICRFSKNPSLALANFTGSSVSSVVINSVQYDLDGVSIDTPRTEPCSPIGMATRQSQVLLAETQCTRHIPLTVTNTVSR